MRYRPGKLGSEGNSKNKPTHRHDFVFHIHS